MRLKNPCIQSAISCCDKLKNEIQKFQIRLCFYFNMRNKIQINDMYFHVKTGFYFEYLMFPFVFIFKKKKKKKWKTKYTLFSVLVFIKELKNELLKQIKNKFMIIFTIWSTRYSKAGSCQVH